MPAIMARYKLILAYDGTNYCGWQVQHDRLSIQALVQNALQTVLRHPLHLTGSGRTDAGVHAKGQTAHFDTDLSINLSSLRLSLNGLLPADIRVLEIESVESDFHARYSALSKTYHYYLHLDRISDPFTIKTRYQVFKRLNLDLLQKAAQEFIGIHDFTSFTNEPQRGSVVRGAVRHLTRLDAFPIEKGIRLEFEANGFLYKMVRNITAALIECASGKVPPSMIKEIFDAKDRRRAFFTAPPQGLFLMHVQYQKTIPHAELLEPAQR